MRLIDADKCPCIGCENIYCDNNCGDYDSWFYGKRKPMTLEEACAVCKSRTPVFVEYKGDGVYAGMVGIVHRIGYDACKVSYVKSAYGGCVCANELPSYYGIEWRCWATVPTDEERKAAKWEE